MISKGRKILYGASADVCGLGIVERRNVVRDINHLELGVYLHQLGPHGTDEIILVADVGC